MVLMFINKVKLILRVVCLVIYLPYESFVLQASIDDPEDQKVSIQRGSGRFGYGTHAAYIYQVTKIVESIDGPLLSVVEKGLQIKEEVEFGNYDDIHFLFDEIQSKCLFHFSKELSETFLQKVIDHILEDKARAQELWERINKAHKDEFIYTGYAPVRTSFCRLSGFGRIMSYFDECIGLLNDSNLDFRTGFVDGEEPCQHFIIILKMTLLYIALEFNGLDKYDNDSDYFKKGKFYFPLSIPADVLDSNIEKLAFLRKVDGKYYLHMPNAGYILGGTYKNRMYKGLDCSSFASLCYGFARQCPTFGMVLIWKLKEGVITNNDIDLLEDFRRNLVLSYKDKFDSISMTQFKESIFPGYLVVWKLKERNGGHVAIFLKWTN